MATKRPLVIVLVTFGLDGVVSFTAAIVASEPAH
jgi:hypothetical protein